jgi:hypothetical protein
MMCISEKSARPVCRILFALLLILSLLASRAEAQNINVASSTEALARVAQLGNDVRAMRAVAATPIGPYDLSTRCTWCSKDFIGICLEHTTETWPAKVDFTWTRSRLNQILAQAQQSADDFPRAFTPVQAWIDSIPAFTAQFDRAADIVLNVQQQIKVGQGPNDQQRQAVTQALQTLISDLAANATQLNNGTSALAAALQQQSTYGPAIRQAIDGADQSATVALANLQTQASTHRCQDGLSDRFNAIKANFSTSIGNISSAFQRLEASRQASDRGLAFLLGAVVSSRTDLQSVMNQINAANNDALGSFLERLHLASAKAQWQQIADYATTRLSRGAEVRNVGDR